MPRKNKKNRRISSSETFSSPDYEGTPSKTEESSERGEKEESKDDSPVLTKAQIRAQKKAKMKAKAQAHTRTQVETQTNEDHSPKGTKNNNQLSSVSLGSEAQELDENFTAHVEETSKSTSQEIHLENFSIYAHQCQLFLETDLHLSTSQRVGLIGRNGQGKTTLLRHLAQRKLPIHQEMDVLYVEQEVAPTDQNPVEVVLSANKIRTKLLARFQEVEQLFEQAEQAEPDLMTEYQELSEQLEALQVDRDEGQVRKLLAGLGFSPTDQNKPVKLFSGGWRMRISLARALYLKPTLLLLDEPTNHLDLNATIWLTDYLSNYWTSSLLVVSHNQDFLNEVCTQIIQIEKQKLVHYHGSYESFKKAHHQRQVEEQKKWDKLQKEVALMRKKSEPRHKVQEHLKKSGLTKPEKPYEVHLRFYEINDLTRPVIEVYDVDFDYTPEKCETDTDYQLLFQKLHFGIDLTTRAVIVGPNGVGKSTLINLLVGALQPLAGEIRRNSVLRIGYYNQHFVEFLPLEKTPVEYLQSISKLTEEELKPHPVQKYRSFLGGMGLPGRTHLTPIKKLSGGQKARVAFCALYVRKPHIIFLDEPTNHLDIETINGLIEAINNFQGGILMVSHDAQLITRTQAELWICQEGQVVPYHGTYEDYRAGILAELETD